MAISDFLYRQKQKWKYHTAANDIERLVAEINLNREEIRLKGSTFTVKDCELEFDVENHSFIIERINLFRRLLQDENSRFSMLDEDLLYHFEEVTLKVTTAEELFIINEVYLENCYNVILPEENFMVVDIGMNVGYTSLFFAKNPKVKSVYGFEPFAHTYEEGLFNFKLNQGIADKIIPINCGLGLKEENILVPFSKKYKGKNSSTRRAVGKAESIQIQIKSAFKTLDDLIKRDQSLKYFIKVDCEGAEFEIFNDFGRNKIPEQVIGFIIEWHERNPLPIVDILLNNNFKVQKSGWNRIGLITAFR